MKIAKIYSQIAIAAWMQPLQYDLRCSAAKDNSITHAVAAPSNLDAATTIRSAETELQNTIELRATVSEIAAPKPDLDAKAEKTILKHFFNIFLKGKLLYQNCENLLANHYRSLDAATPIRFTMFSCKRQ